MPITKNLTINLSLRWTMRQLDDGSVSIDRFLLSDDGLTRQPLPAVQVAIDGTVVLGVTGAPATKPIVVAAGAAFLAARDSTAAAINTLLGALDAAGV